MTNQKAKDAPSPWGKTDPAGHHPSISMSQGKLSINLISKLSKLGQVVHHFKLCHTPGEQLTTSPRSLLFLWTFPLRGTKFGRKTKVRNKKRKKKIKKRNPLSKYNPLWKYLIFKRFIACNGCFGLFTNEKGPGAFGCRFSAWFAHKNVPYLIFC